MEKKSDKPNAPTMSDVTSRVPVVDLRISPRPNVRSGAGWRMPNPPKAFGKANKKS